MKLSKHASTRSKQRGFSRNTIDYIIKYGSIRWKPGNAKEIRVKKSVIHEAIEDRKKEIRLLENLKGKAILLSGDDDCIITMYHIH